MKVSIITTTFNSGKTVERTLRSVASQDYTIIEHIIVDGGSGDDTLELVGRYPHVSKVISEADKGVYDALNKGLDLATGEVVGLLHSDDVFHHPLSIARVVSALVEHPEWTGTYADVRFVDPEGFTTRHYSCEKWKFSDFARGIMPAHPSFFARREAYLNERFDLRYQIAADFDLLLRLFQKEDALYGYIPFVITDMSPGGMSTRNWKSNLIINREIREICRQHGIPTSYLKIYSKYWQRLQELT